MDVVDLPLEQMIAYTHYPQSKDAAIATVIVSLKAFGWHQTTYRGGESSYDIQCQ